MLKLFRLHVPELRFWKIKKEIRKNRNRNRRKTKEKKKNIRKKTEGKKHGVYAF